MFTRRTNAGACSSDICNRGGGQESMIAEELTCSGLAYLERLLSEAELDARTTASTADVFRRVGHPRAAVVSHRSVGDVHVPSHCFRNAGCEDPCSTSQGTSSSRSPAISNRKVQPIAAAKAAPSNVVNLMDALRASLKSGKRPRRQREHATTSGSSVSFVTPCETDCFQRPTLPTLSSLMACCNREIVEAQ